MSFETSVPPTPDDELEREMRRLGATLQRLYAVERTAVPDDMELLIGRLAQAIDNAGPPGGAMDARRCAGRK